jgi:transposase
MPNRRLSMRMIKEVLRLHHSCGLSNKQISASLRCSRGAVAEYLHRAEAAGLSWPLPEELDDLQIEQRLFAPSRKYRGKALPDFNYVHTELKKKGVTLIQLWSEYREEHPDGYGLSQFCDLYGQFRKNLSLVMRIEHKAGEKAFSDFAGKKIPIVIDSQTGEAREAHLFVCTLGASSFTFADLFWDETVESWCNGHAAAFTYFDGATKFVVPDNPKPVVTKACPYEPDINPSFAQMAAHYDIVVIPARVRRPKDKAKVEAAVGLATRWILAVLRNRTFFILAEARVAVRELLDKLNDRPFKKIPGSRRSLYESVDKPALKPLPMVPYEYAHFKKASVNIDYHVVYDDHFYSVPYQFRGEVVEVRATFTTVEIFRRGKRIASHPRGLPDYKASTIHEHRPKNHQQYGDWPPERIIDWARKIGPSTTALAEAIMARKEHPELGYRSCLGILRLAKKFSDARLESACNRALAIRGLSYKSMKSILESNLDQRPLPEKPHQLTIVHTNIRGAGAFTLPDKENDNANTSNNRHDEIPEALRHGEGLGGATGTEGSP